VLNYRYTRRKVDEAMKRSCGLVTGVLLTVAMPLYAQSLGDLAKKEQERRKSAPPATRTYTNEDLKKLPPVPGAAPAKAGDDKTSAKGAAGTPGNPAKLDDKDTTLKGEGAAGEPAKDEKYWRGRITAVREEIRRNEMFRDALQTRINALAADFAGRDDPFQRAKIADDRQKALAELARVTLDIDTANKSISAIEEEARRAGVPAGWVR
jgi:hypothetical protein